MSYVFIYFLVQGSVDNRSKPCIMQIMETRKEHEVRSTKHDVKYRVDKGLKPCIMH